MYDAPNCLSKYYSDSISSMISSITAFANRRSYCSSGGLTWLMNVLITYGNEKFVRTIAVKLFVIRNDFIALACSEA